MPLSTDDMRRIRRLNKIDADMQDEERRMTVAEAQRGRIVTSFGSGGALESFYREHLEGAVFRKGHMFRDELFTENDTALYAYSRRLEDNFSVGSGLRAGCRYRFPRGFRAGRYAQWVNLMLLVDAQTPTRSLKLRRDPATSVWYVVESKGWGQNGVALSVHSESRRLRMTTMLV